MRVLVLGAKGMLGEAVSRAVQQHGHELSSHSIDVRHADQLRVGLSAFRPEAVINCAGVIPEKVSHAPHVMVGVNSLGPQLVASIFNCHVVHVSTDCVFSGKRKFYNYTVSDLPDPDTLYGRSKLAGELSLSHTTTVRTSFIGPNHGIMKWFLGQPAGASVDGWAGAFWSGSTVNEVARNLVEIAVGPPLGLVHLATKDSISKYYLLRVLQSCFQKTNVEIVKKEEPYINRSLEPTIVLPTISSVIQELKQ